MSSREDRVRIVLLGKSVSENSGVGNFILGRAAFDSEAPPYVVERIGGRLKDRHLTIINSPQLLQTNISDHQITHTVRECLNLSDPGPHVIVLLLNHKQCSAEDQECVEKVLDSFSERVYQHTMVLTAQETTETNEILQKIIKKCTNRHFSLKRSSSPDDLLQIFEDVVQMNDGRPLVWAEYEATQYFTTKHKATERRSAETEGEVRIVLLGKSGVGKSATGNTILGRDGFKADTSHESITKETQKEKAKINGRQITVIDTPGLFDTELANKEIQKEITNCISMILPGPHVFLLLIPLGRFTQEEAKSVKIIQEMFGENSLMYTMVLFTRGGDLKNKTFQQYLGKPGSPLMNLIEMCGNRYHVFNNDQTKDRTQVTDLLEKIDNMVAANGGSFYSCKMFRKMEREKQEQQMNTLMETVEQLNRERKELVKKHEKEKERMKMVMEEERQNQDKERKRREEKFNRNVTEQEAQLREIRDEMKRKQDKLKHEIEKMKQEKAKIKIEKEYLQAKYDTEIGQLMNTIENERQSHDKERKRIEQEYNQREERYRQELKEKNEEMKRKQEAFKADMEKIRLVNMTESKKMEELKEREERHKREMATERETTENMKGEQEMFNNEMEQIMQKENETMSKENLKTKYDTQMRLTAEEKERNRRGKTFSEKEELYKTEMGGRGHVKRWEREKQISDYYQSLGSEMEGIKREEKTKRKDQLEEFEKRLNENTLFEEQHEEELRVEWSEKYESEKEGRMKICSETHDSLQFQKITADGKLTERIERETQKQLEDFEKNIKEKKFLDEQQEEEQREELKRERMGWREEFEREIKICSEAHDLLQFQKVTANRELTETIENETLKKNKEIIQKVKLSEEQHEEGIKRKLAEWREKREREKEGSMRILSEAHDSLQVTAKRKLETEFRKWSWTLHNTMMETEHKLHNKIENAEIQKVEETDLQKELKMTSKEVKKLMSEFFDKDTDANILIQWKTSYDVKIKELQETLVRETYRRLNGILQQQDLKKKIDAQRTQHENTLYEKSKELALKFKDRTNDEETLKKEFELFWKQCLENISKETHQIKDIDILKDVKIILNDIYGSASLYHKWVSRDIFSALSYLDYVQLQKSNRFTGHTKGNFISAKKVFECPLSNEDEAQIRLLVTDVAEQTNKLIMSFNISKMGYNKSCIHQITDYIKARVTKHQEGRVKYVFNNEFFMDLVLSIFKRANKMITDQHRLFREANDSVMYVEKIRKEYYSIFQKYYHEATSVDFGEDICQKLKEFIEQSVYKKTARDLADEMRSNCPSLNGNRSNLEKHILKTLAEEEEFDKYMDYIHNPREHFKSFIRDEVSWYITDKFSVSVLPKMKENIKLLQQKIIKAAHQSTEHVQENRGGVGLWLKSFTQQLSDELIFSEKDLSGVKHDYLDFNLVEDVIRKELFALISEISDHFSDFLRKLDLKNRPAELLIDHFCQCCWVHCPFCGATCNNTIENHDGAHDTPFHRVLGLSGLYYDETKNLCDGFCSTTVTSNFFKSSSQWFETKKHRKAGGVYADYSISPNLSGLPYWKWVVCRFQKDLERYYNKQFEQSIQDEWRQCTKQDATQSLDEC